VIRKLKIHSIFAGTKDSIQKAEEKGINGIEIITEG